MPEVGKIIPPELKYQLWSSTIESDHEDSAPASRLAKSIHKPRFQVSMLLLHPYRERQRPASFGKAGQEAAPGLKGDACVLDFHRDRSLAPAHLARQSAG